MPDQFQNVSREEDPFVPTCQDLTGFWDMVSIQVDQIHDRFSKLGDLRKADWIVKVILLFASLYCVYSTASQQCVAATLLV